MVDVTYSPGDQYLLLVGRVLVLALPRTSVDVETWWATVSDGDDPLVVLDAIVRHGLTSAPSFVLARGDADGTDLVTRGDSAVVADDGRELDGRGLAAWRESRLEAGVGVEVGDLSSDRLPLAHGVVRAGGFRLGRPGEPKSDSAASSAPTLAPPPPPPPPPPAVVAESTPAAEISAPPSAEHDPGRTLTSQTIGAPPVWVEPAGTPVEVAADGGYDHLFGETIMRNVEDAAVRSPEEPSAVEDHTTFVDRAALRARRGSRASAPAAAPAPSFSLALSTGGIEPLTQPLIFGRAPEAHRVSGANLPRLVVMSTPNQDISRTHAHVEVQGGTVVVTDLHSRNGTVVTMPGMPAQQLRPGEPTAVLAGTVIDLGDGATLTVVES